MTDLRAFNYQVWRCDDEADGCPDVNRTLIAEAGHIARHQPARVLREIAAKRRLLAERRPSEAYDLLHALAAVWSDHPDYLPEWT